MKRRIEYLFPAISDIERIWQYVAGSSGVTIADRLIDKIDASLHQTIALHPNSGRLRPELGPEIRSFPIVPYVAFYQVAGRNVQILRVLHGRRDIREPLMSLLAAV